MLTGLINFILIVALIMYFWYAVFDIKNRLK